MRAEPSSPAFHENYLLACCRAPDILACTHAEDVAPPQRGSNLLQTNLQNNQDNRNNFHYGSNEAWQRSYNQWRDQNPHNSWCDPLA